MDISPHVAPEAHPLGEAAPPHRPEILDVAVLLLLAALLRLGHQPAPAIDPQHANLRRTIRLFCDDAREQNLSAEQLIVILKRAWATICHGEGRSMSVKNDALLHSVVSMCIQEFYREP